MKKFKSNQVIDQGRGNLFFFNNNPQISQEKNNTTNVVNL